jgi:hypothetical protein
MYYPELWSPAESPEATERFQFIQEKMKLGIDLDTCIGVHGTSLFSLIEGIRTGFIPGTVTHEDEWHDPTKRDLYFMPLKRHQEMIPFDLDYEEENDAMRSVESYASAIAFAHAFFREVGLPIEDPELQRTYHAKQFLQDGFTNEKEIQNLRDSIKNDSPEFRAHIERTIQQDIEAEEEMVAHFRELGIGRDQLACAKIKAHIFKGVLLGLHPTIFQDYDVLLGDRDQGDLRLRSDRGLDIRHITGCSVSGLLERKIVKKWAQGR